MASRWRHCANLTSPAIELQTSRTDNVHLATELTNRFFFKLSKLENLRHFQFHDMKIMLVKVSLFLVWTTAISFISVFPNICLAN